MRKGSHTFPEKITLGGYRHIYNLDKYACVSKAWWDTEPSVAATGRGASQ